MSGAKATPRLAPTCNVVARMSGSRLPTVSLHGPIAELPDAETDERRDERQLITASLAFSSSATTGNAGK